MIVTIEDAIETYKKTKLNCLQHEFAGWINAVDQALAGDESALQNHPSFAKQVYEHMKAEGKKVSMSDSK